MIKAKHVLAVVALATGVSALAAPTASAADPATPPSSLMHELDEFGTSALPPERRDEVPPISSQLNGLSQVHELH